MKNIILGILGLGLIVFLFINSSKNKEVEVEKDGNTVEEVVIDETENTENPETISMLTANTWTWEKTQMNDDTVVIPKNESAFTLTFTADGNVSGTTDCNSFSGGYTLGSGGSISFGTMATTLMFCDNSQEAAFTKSVTESNMIFFTEDKNLVLLLPYDSGSVIFKK